MIYRGLRRLTLPGIYAVYQGDKLLWRGIEELSLTAEGKILFRLAAALRAGEAALLSGSGEVLTGSAGALTASASAPGSARGFIRFGTMDARAVPAILAVGAGNILLEEDAVLLRAVSRAATPDGNAGGVSRLLLLGALSQAMQAEIGTAESRGAAHSDDSAPAASGISAGGESSPPGYSGQGTPGSGSSGVVLASASYGNSAESVLSASEIPAQSNRWTLGDAGESLPLKGGGVVISFGDAYGGLGESALLSGGGRLKFSPALTPGTGTSAALEGFGALLLTGYGSGLLDESRAAEGCTGASAYGSAGAETEDTAGWAVLSGETLTIYRAYAAALSDGTLTIS